MKTDDVYGVDLSKCSSEKELAQFFTADVVRLQVILFEILSFVRKQKSESKEKSIHYRYNGFGSAVWGEDQELICNLLKQVGYNADRHEEYHQFVDVSLRVSW